MLIGIQLNQGYTKNVLKNHIVETPISVCYSSVLRSITQCSTSTACVLIAVDTAAVYKAIHLCITLVSIHKFECVSANCLIKA